MGRIRNESLKGSGRWILVLWEAPKEREKVGQLRCGRPGRQGVTSCRGWESSQKLLTGTGRQRTKRSANTWRNHDIDCAVLGALPLEVTEERCGCSLGLSARCTRLSPTTVHTVSWPLPLGHGCEWIKVIWNQLFPFYLFAPTISDIFYTSYFVIQKKCFLESGNGIRNLAFIFYPQLLSMEHAHKRWRAKRNHCKSQTQLRTEGPFLPDLSSALGAAIQLTVASLSFSCGALSLNWVSSEARGPPGCADTCWEGLIKPLATDSATTAALTHKRHVRHDRVLFMSSCFWKKGPETLKMSSETVTS